MEIVIENNNAMARNSRIKVLIFSENNTGIMVFEDVCETVMDDAFCFSDQ